MRWTAAACCANGPAEGSKNRYSSAVVSCSGEKAGPPTALTSGIAPLIEENPGTRDVDRRPASVTSWAVRDDDRPCGLRTTITVSLRSGKPNSWVEICSARSADECGGTRSENEVISDPPRAGRATAIHTAPPIQARITG